MRILCQFNSGLKSEVLVSFKVSSGKAVTDSQGDIIQIIISRSFIPVPRLKGNTLS